LVFRGVLQSAVSSPAIRTALQDLPKKATGFVLYVQLPKVYSKAACDSRKKDGTMPNHLIFKVDDTAVILIDHQVGTCQWACTTPLDLLKKNVLNLAKFAKGTNMPIVLTSSQETNVNIQGPL